MEYYDVYRRRLNRYGDNYQARVQGQRDRNFDDYLLKSIYRVDFWYNDNLIPATLESFKQDYTQTQCYLLTRREDIIPNGTIIHTMNLEGEEKCWMVWWLENAEARGYNKYVVLRMTHMIRWRDAEKEYEQWAYFCGTGTSKISYTLKSSSGEAVYNQNDNLHMFITPHNNLFSNEQYFEVVQGDNTQGFVVTEKDIHSTPGVMYLSIDPVSLRNKEEKVSTPSSWLTR